MNTSVKSALSSISKGLGKASSKVAENQQGAKSDDSTSYTPPKMHAGGPVPADGTYALKAGEHVLTAAEAAKARQHGLMAAGLKSLAKPAPKAGKPTASIGAIDPMPAKPKTFTDKNLDRGFGEGGANNVTTRNAKPGGTISASPNATKQMGAAKGSDISKT